jgi:CBS domain containing-hemolysin-like protein
LDDVLGTIHIKDVLATIAKGQPIDIKALIREIPIVSPAMPIIDLMLTMRQSRRHMVLVVDEYGGIDGLVTVNDVIEAIVGEIEDEHDTADGPKINRKSDGSVVVDARLSIDEFEYSFGTIFNEEERNSSDTLSGLVVDMTGRIPARGEVITHSSGMVFEVLDADPRRVNVLKIRNIPQPIE